MTVESQEFSMEVMVGVWRPSPQPPEAIGDLGVLLCPQPPKARESVGVSPSAGQFLQFFNKNNAFLCLIN